MKPLLQPARFGAIELKNRIVMAPLTRCRASGADGRTPNALMKEYYAQRAGAGLILTEATSVTPMGVGYPNTPGLWSEEHVKHWGVITNAVHRAGGAIVAQLWHVGRVSDSSYLNGAQPVSASAIAAPGHVNLLRPQKNYEVPRPLATEEIAGVVAEYRRGAAQAKRAGFDGVEVHGANGYLPDQFLRDGSNRRTDRYGGGVENRARFLLEVTDAAIAEWGADRVGVHLSPRSIPDSNSAATFGYVAAELGRRRVAFLCVREFEAGDSLLPAIKRAFGGPVIGNEKFTFATAEAALTRGDVDAVAFGQAYIANPDLVRRHELNAPLNAPNPSLYYGPDRAGYVDYPFLDEAA